MTTLIQLIEILFNRRKVEDLQYNHISLVLAIVGYTLVNYWFSQIDTIYGTEIQNVEISIPLAVVHSLFISGILYKLLDMNTKSERFYQSAIALFGSYTITTALAILTMPYPMLVLFGLAFVTWSVVIFVRVLKQTFEISSGKAFLYFIGINLAGNFALTVALSLTGGLPEK